MKKIVDQRMGSIRDSFKRDTAPLDEELTKEESEEVRYLKSRVDMGLPVDKYDPEETVYERHFIKSDPEDRDVRVEELGLLPETLKELRRYKLWYVSELDTLGATHEFLNKRSLFDVDAYDVKEERPFPLERVNGQVEEFLMRGKSLVETFPLSPIMNFKFPHEVVTHLPPFQTYMLTITHVMEVTRELTHYSAISTLRLKEWKVKLFLYLDANIPHDISDEALLWYYENNRNYRAIENCIFEETIPNTMLEETKQMQGKTIMRLLPESYADIDRVLKLRKEQKI